MARWSRPGPRVLLFFRGFCSIPAGSNSWILCGGVNKRHATRRQPQSNTLWPHCRGPLCRADCPVGVAGEIPRYRAGLLLLWVLLFIDDSVLLLRNAAQMARLMPRVPTLFDSMGLRIYISKSCILIARPCRLVFPARCRSLLLFPPRNVLDSFKSLRQMTIWLPPSVARLLPPSFPIGPFFLLVPCASACSIH